jgi:hypothetical protein
MDAKSGLWPLSGGSEREKKHSWFNNLARNPREHLKNRGKEGKNVLKSQKPPTSKTCFIECSAFWSPFMIHTRATKKQMKICCSGMIMQKRV